jgi:UDP:flavonoid glycosyltransferase YjiC (YdhE family)
MAQANTQPVLKPGTKILFANVPADGHFNPLTGIAVHLKEIGCDVRWYTSPYYREKIQKLDIPFLPLKKALDIGGISDPDKFFPERKKHKSQLSKLKFDMIEVFIKRGPEYYEDIIEIRKEFPFEVMIADITFGAIPLVKEHMGVPVVGIDIIPLPETSKDLPPCGLGLTPSYSFLGKCKQSFLRFIADKLLFAHPTKVMVNMLAEYGVQSNGSNIFDICVKKSSLVLQSGTPGFEYKRSDISKHVHFVGPLLPYTKKEQGKKWFDARLKIYKKVVLVTQGTVEKDVTKIIVPTLEAFKGTDTLVVVTTGGSGTTELRSKYSQQNIIIEDFIPFADIMPYANVYITNGGYGGVLLSIQHNLPMVVAGIHEGKNEINARIGYFGLGINLKTEKPNPEKIKAAVQKICEDSSFKQRVIALNTEFNSYDTFTLAEKHIATLVKPSVIVNRTNRIKEDIAIY